MIGQGFPLIGQPLRTSSNYAGLRPAPSPFSVPNIPNDFPQRGGYGYEQLPQAPGGVAGGIRTGNPAPTLGVGGRGSSGRRGPSMTLGGRSPVLNPFQLRQQRQGSLRVPVLGVR
jgi:hypothetical protein